MYTYVQCKVISSQVLVLKVLMAMEKSGDLSPCTAVTLVSSGSMSLENLL